MSQLINWSSDGLTQPSCCFRDNVTDMLAMVSFPVWGATSNAQAGIDFRAQRADSAMQSSRNALGSPLSA